MLAAMLLAVQEPEVFFGNLHSHTSYSDGSGTPEEAYAHARSVGLDFLALTEHSHAAAEGSGEPDGNPPVHIARDPILYAGPGAHSLIETAGRVNAVGGFLALYGQEFSSISKGNHVNVFDVGEVIDVANGDFASLLDGWLATRKDSAGLPAILQFNHPALHDDDTNEYGRDDFPTVQAWLAAMKPHACLIEVLNGPAMAKTPGNRPGEVMERDFLTYLNLGFRLAPTADQDNHWRTWGDCTDARTAVLAPELTKAAVMQALRERRVYASEDKNLKLIPRVGGQLIGSSVTVLPADGTDLSISIRIMDEDEPEASYRIDVFSDDAPGGQLASVAESFFRDGPGTHELTGIPFTGAGQYVFMRVTQTNEEGERDRAWTAPVWFEAGAGPTEVPLALHIDSLLPNPVGDDSNLEQATIHNVSAEPALMTGWTLRDRTGNVWHLDSLGQLDPNQSKTIVRHGKAMAMNNKGPEVIQLINPDGFVVDEIAYDGAAEGQVIVHPRPEP